MKKLKKPIRYSDINVEFYGSETPGLIQPVQPVNQTQNNLYSPSGSNSGLGGSSGGNHQSSGSFQDALKEAMNKISGK